MLLGLGQLGAATTALRSVCQCMAKGSSVFIGKCPEQAFPRPKTFSGCMEGNLWTDKLIWCLQNWRATFRRDGVCWSWWLLCLLYGSWRRHDGFVTLKHGQQCAVLGERRQYSHLSLPTSSSFTKLKTSTCKEGRGMKHFASSQFELSLNILVCGCLSHIPKLWQRIKRVNRHICLENSSKKSGVCFEGWVKMFGFLAKNNKEVCIFLDLWRMKILYVSVLIRFCY